MSESYPQRGFALPPDANEVILVRHAASEAAVPGEPFALTDGHGDPPLAPEGAPQARAVAQRLAAEQLAAIFTTGLRRTVQTAAPLVEQTALLPIEIPQLREIKLGDWEGGELRIRVAQGDPLVPRLFGEQRWDVIPNAEAMDAFGARVRAGIAEIVARLEPGDVAAAFVHGAVIGELCRQATGSRPFAFILSDNASLTRLIVMGDGRWLLRSYNDVAHLAGLAAPAAAPRAATSAQTV